MSASHQHDDGRSRHFQQLVDSGPSHLLDEVSLEELARAWCCYHERRPSADDDPDLWAVDAWITGLPKDRVREGLRLLVETAEGENVLEMIGAGPLEDFASDDEADLRWIEAMARQNSRFRAALRSVWTSSLRDATAARLLAACGAPSGR